MTGPRNVLALIGTSYCGSTLAACLANMHPQFVSVGEVAPNRSIRRRGGALDLHCSCGRRLPECGFWRDIFQRVQAQGFKFSSTRWSNDYRYLNPALHRLFNVYSDRPLHRRLQHLASYVVPWHKYMIWRTNAVTLAFIDAALDRARATIFFDTTKSLKRVYYLMRIKQLDVQVIRAVRDVRAFVLSKKRRGVSAADAAMQWRRFQLAAEHFLRDVPDNCVLWFRYEDLCRNPDTWMNKICQHYNIPEIALPQEIDPREHHILGNSSLKGSTTRVRLNESWRTELSLEEMDTALRIAGDLNEKYGYQSEAAKRGADVEQVIP